MSKKSQLRHEIKAEFKKLGIKSTRNQRAVLAATFTLLEAYDEVSGTVDSRGKMLKAMSKLPGGIQALSSALAQVDVQATLNLDSEIRDTIRDGTGESDSYRSSLFSALNEYYGTDWYYHPHEERAAEHDGRDPEQGHYDDVYHVGMFALCEAVEHAYLASLLPTKPRYFRYVLSVTAPKAVSQTPG